MLIYRILVLPDELSPIDLERLPLQSWTEDFSGLDVSGLLEPPLVDPVDVVIVAEVDEESIDAERTALLRQELPWEMEIALKPDAEVRIAAVHRYHNGRGLGAMIEDHPSLPPRPAPGRTR